ncbi:MAG: HEPN domain-containing protein [Caldilineaceae bacterium]|nr:HEPN domain-containing protein [Caldilineaceae bacterium]MDE0339057.1 HEPN domain-containing protein [Caldilineaceae bacterium]
MSVRPPEQDWFEKAEKDMVMARRAMDPEGPIPEMACYHSQQCAEKSLKGYLVSQKLDFLYVHDLVYLTQRCMEGKQDFTELEQAARILSKYGAGVRYPMEDFVDPDEEEAWEAIGLAGEVATFVKSQR